MIETTDSNIHPVDSLIERTLSRDAERTRNRFAAVPNAQLTAKLALSTASRGLLGSLGAKLALYAGGALLIGSAAYFIPSIGQQPHSTTSTAAPSIHSVTPAVQHSSATASLRAKTEITTSIAPHPAVIPPISQPAHSLKLDEGDGKSIPHYTDPKYEGPLK